MFLLCGAAYAIALVVLGRIVPGRAPEVLVCAVHAVVLVACVSNLRWLGVLTAAGFIGLALGATARLDLALVDVAILAAFGALLLGLRDLVRRAGMGEMPARLVPVVIGVGLLTTFCWSGPFIEALPEPAYGVQVAVRVNPLACIAGGVHGVDWARARPVTYDLFVGQYYPFSYPSPIAALLGWVAAGGLFGVFGGIVARRESESGLPFRAQNR